MSNKNLETIKVILLGDTGVGKSSIIKRYYEDVFDQNMGTTFGSNFIEKIVTFEGKKVKLEIWDTAGQEEYRSVTKIFVKNSKIIILVYSVVDKRTFDCLNYWYDFIQREIGPSVIMGLAGNKTDLIFEEEYKEEVTSLEGKEYAKKIGATFSLVSAKESNKEIITLFQQCLERYLDIKPIDEEINGNIKLSETIAHTNNKSECCGGKNKKNIKIKMVFLGSNGVGKTSIIKAIKGKGDINKLEHTKKTNKEEITYTKNGRRITVQLKDTNGDECQNEIFDKAIAECKVFFMVFDIYKQDTLYKLESWLDKINTKENKVYLLGYTNDSIEDKNSELDCTKEVEKFTSKYNCEYYAITIEDIYKIKAIILENITDNLKKLGY